jgi:hypothetical protein
VRTDGSRGLTEADVDLAIAMFAWPTGVIPEGANIERKDGE